MASFHYAASQLTPPFRHYAIATTLFSPRHYFRQLLTFYYAA
jgi:hypothetical protein